MIEGVNSSLSLGKLAGGGVAPAKLAGAGGAGGSSFADVLKSSIDEVAKLQQDAGKAVEHFVSTQPDNITGVMTAMEKADVALKTLLAIRGKLMDAYDEIKNISV